MNEVPENTSILGRQRGRVDFERCFPQLDALLTDVVNYGSTLVPKALDASAKALEDMMILGGLLKQVVMMLDATHILLLQGASTAASLPSRALLEAAIYLRWMLLRDTRLRAQYYYVSNLRRDASWARRFLDGTPESEDFAHVHAFLRASLPPDPKLKAVAAQQLQEIEAFLADADLQPINACFSECVRRKRPRREPKWFEPLGSPSIRRLAKDLGDLVLYDVFYSSSSLVTHSSSYKDHLRTHSHKTFLLPIRHPKGVPMITTASVGTTLRVYRAVLDRYLPQEVKGFAARYQQNWAPLYHGLKEVECSDEEGELRF